MRRSPSGGLLIAALTLTLGCKVGELTRHADGVTADSGAVEHPAPDSTATDSTATDSTTANATDTDSTSADSTATDSTASDSTATDSTASAPTWTSAAPMPEARWQLAAASLEGVVYVAGGVVDHGSGWEALNDILAYDPSRDSWRTVGRLLEAVRAPAMVALNNLIYIIGGCRDNPFEPITAVQIFDPVTGIVERGPPLPYGRCASAAVVLDGRIHDIGGVNLWDPSDPLFGDAWDAAHHVYDPVAGAWSSAAPLPFVRGDHGATVLDGKIYVQGGLGDVLQVYDPAADSWSTFNAPKGRFGVASIAFEGRMYEFGGSEYQSLCCGGPIPSRTVDRFDPVTGTWALLPSMPTARTGLAAAVVGGAAYVIGGSLTGGASSAVSVVERYTLPRR